MKTQAKKKFGQNFISDKNLIKKIIDTLDQNKNQLIIEIGPGTGALTKELVKRFKKVIAIEIDTEMEDVLKQEINSENLEIIIEDVLKIDLKEVVEKNKKLFSEVSIISNMPYYITSEILFKTLSLNKYLNKAVFMMQKEVALRVCAKAGENNYNNLSIACEFFANRKYEFTVKKNMFYPIPKVDSSIVSFSFINKYEKEVKDVDDFLVFVRKIFNNKRKTILNNLTNLTKDKAIAKEILNDLKISESLRPEVIEIKNFINIFNNYAKYRQNFV